MSSHENAPQTNPINAEAIAEAIERCLISPNVADSNGESANLVDVINDAAHNMNRIALAITPTHPHRLPPICGSRIPSLTEAVLEVAISLDKIAGAIESLADAVQKHGR